jgi:hypothetical protein
MAKSNQPLLDELTDQQRAAILNGADAVKTLADFKRRTFDLYMDVARGVAPLCEIADRRGMARKARAHLLKDNGYGSLNPSTVSRLLWMAKLENAIRAWRDTDLTQNKRDSWNSPTSICNRCPAVRKAIEQARENKPPRTPKKKDVMAAVEKALDVIGDLAYGLKDADQRAVIKERLLQFAKQFGKRGTLVDDDEPSPDKPTVKVRKQAPALHTPHKDVKTKPFCAPTAIAAITGEPVSVVRDAIRQASGKMLTSAGKAHPVMGVDNSSVLKAMALLGWHVVERRSVPSNAKRYTLDAFAKDHGDDGPFIVNVPGHYVTISNGEFCDTYTKGPQALSDGALEGAWYGGRKRKGSTGVQKWWRFEKTEKDDAVVK